MSDEPQTAEQNIHELINQALLADSNEDSERASEVLVSSTYAEYRDFIFEVLNVALKTPGPQMRIRGLQILARFGPAAKSCLPEILPLLNDEQSSVAAVAACTHFKIEGNAPASEPLLRALQSEDEFDRQVGFWAVAELGPAAASLLPKLSQALEDSDGDVRVSVAKALLRIATDAFKNKQIEVATTAFAPFHKDRDEGIRRAAYDIIAELTPSAATAAILKEGLSDDSPRVRSLCAFVLSKFRDFSDEFQSTLRQSLRDSDLDVRGAAAISLALLQLQDKSVIATLTEVAENGSGELKSLAGDVLKMVLENAVDRSFAHAQEIDDLGQSLSRDAGDQEVNRLLQILQDSTGDVRERADAAQLLQHIGPRAAAAIPLLKQLYDSEEHYYIRTRAFDALMVIAADDPKSLPMAIAALRDSQEIVRFRAAFVLRTLGKDSQDALLALQRATQDSSEIVREAATESVRQLSPNNSPDGKPWWKFW